MICAKHLNFKRHVDTNLKYILFFSRIKYGGLTSSDEDDLGRGRRTRGKKTTYVDTLGSDSEEEAISNNPRKIVSDDDEDFVANEEDEVRYSQLTYLYLTRNSLEQC